ncbi:hypothetical protein JNL27_16855 [bacterium]|nr:hypothetical protein [bacterium]
MNKKKYAFTLALILVFLGCDKLDLGKDSGQKPVIDGVDASRTSVLNGDTTTLYVNARDLNGENLDYVWTTLDEGAFVKHDDINTTVSSTDTSVILWKAPSSTGIKRIRIRVNNESGKSAFDTVSIFVAGISSPIVTIDSPSNNDFISASTDSIYIQAHTLPSTLDSMKCYVNGVQIGRSLNSGASSFVWHVLHLNGPQTIRVQAWEHLLTGSTTTGEASINISIEGTVSKRRP